MEIEAVSCVGRWSHVSWWRTCIKTSRQTRHRNIWHQHGSLSIIKKLGIRQKWFSSVPVYDYSTNIAPNALFTFCSCVYRAMILLMVLMWCCRCISSSPGTIRCQGSPGGLGGATTGTQLLHLLQLEMCIQWRQRGGSMGGNHRVDRYYWSNIPDWGKSVVAVAGVLVGTWGQSYWITPTITHQPPATSSK